MYGNSFTRRGKKITAAVLRQNLTPAEAVLWEVLRARQMAGSRWRRQAPVFGWIADFYCPRYRLIVEVDGTVHELPAQQAYDKKRQTILETTYGFKVLRFTNNQVFYHLDDVKAELEAIVTGPLPGGPKNKRWA